MTPLSTEASDLVPESLSLVEALVDGESELASFVWESDESLEPASLFSDVVG